jgi:ketosteroid isomerase-like protein
MRTLIIVATASALTAGAAFADVKKVPYTEVKVDIPEPIKADPALEAMQKAFAEAVARKDAAAVAALVGPTFVWLSHNSPSEEFDMGRDALHNFKVAFGFRDYGQDSDGGVADGPFWDELAIFANDAKYYQDVGSLICGPIVGSIRDDAALERAKQKIGADDSIDWYFTLAETTVTASPGSGNTVGKIGVAALPVLSTYPKDAEGVALTHYEVLLPTGKSGFVPKAAARAFVNDSLCYAKTAQGEWKIAAFDQAE